MPDHQSVLKEAVLGFAPSGTEVFLDLTFGLGGHSLALLEKFPAARCVGVDRDANMLDLAQERFPEKGLGERPRLICANFSEAVETLAEEGFKADYILMDLGLNSAQLDSAERGFSFMRTGPLDMRMNPTEPSATAAEIVNTFSEKDLAQIFWDWGEERFARKIARKITEARAAKPFETTADLSALVERAVPRPPGKRGIHPATKVFQALRICVNKELESLEKALDVLPKLTRKGTRLATISFHSLEDRPVKQRFRLWNSDCVCDKSAPLCICNHQRTVEVITKKPVMADLEETQNNPRSRSARLRVVEFI